MRKYTGAVIRNSFFRNFLKSARRKKEFRLAVGADLSEEKLRIIVILRENLSEEELKKLPQLQAMWASNLCLKYSENNDEMAARIRYVIV